MSAGAADVGVAHEYRGGAVGGGVRISVGAGGPKEMLPDGSQAGGHGVSLM
jgi:hypothetical protein